MGAGAGRGGGGALERWASGDADGPVCDALLAAMAEPLEPPAATPSRSSDGEGRAPLDLARDAARSQILGDLISAILATTAHGASSQGLSGALAIGGPGAGDRAPHAVFGGRRELPRRGGSGSSLPAAEAPAAPALRALAGPPAPGWEVALPLRFEQQPRAEARVRAALAAFEALRARGIRVRDDAALAAALQALRLCRHGEDARSARLLPRLMGAAMAIGVVPGPRTRRAVLGALEDLDARGGGGGGGASGGGGGGDGSGGLGAFAYAWAPAAAVGGVSLADALSLARSELAPGAAGASAAWRWGGAAERVAAGVMRTLAFERAFGGGGGGQRQ